MPRFEGRTLKWDEINIKRIKIKRFVNESLEVDGQIFKEYEMFKENEKLFVLDQERLNKINLNANYEGKSFEELEKILGNKSDEMKDLNGLYFQIKNKAIILYLIYTVQNKLNPSVILNDEELKECEKLLKEGEERPLKFENLKEEEFNKRTILNTVYWIYEDINGFFNDVTKKYIEYKH
uniref:Uncharacterized protein n=1 Tax=Meloidogyne enterolobii TaxID=390850 RepID=A0A6V7U6E7_MELEN|nr:unnamed protein product [Meloidogyne enterolobii]